MRTRVTGNADNRAASALAPIACTARPNAVWSLTSHAERATPRKRGTGSCRLPRTGYPSGNGVSGSQFQGAPAKDREEGEGRDERGHAERSAQGPDGSADEAPGRERRDDRDRHSPGVRDEHGGEAAGEGHVRADRQVFHVEPTRSNILDVRVPERSFELRTKRNTQERGCRVR